MASASPAVAGSPPSTKPANRVFYPGLDGLRGIAFLAVFFHHYHYFDYGWVGVDCFFALSGFLITGILYDTVDAPHRVRSFYARRTLRIFPLYYGIVLVILLAAPFAHFRWDARWLLWPAYLGNWLAFFHRGVPDLATREALFAWLRPGRHGALYFGHFWSLCVEEQFYLVWPWVVFVVRTRKTLLRICYAAIVLCPILRIVTLRLQPSGWAVAGVVNHATPFRVDTLMVGAAAALLYRGEYRERLLTFARPLAWCAAGIAIFFIAPPKFFFTPGWIDFVSGIGLTLVALLSVALILRVLSPGSHFAKLFSFGPLRWLGRISYGAYVFHDIPHLYYAHLVHDDLGATAAVALVFTIVLAYLSYRFFETPFLRLKTHFEATG